MFDALIPDLAQPAGWLPLVFMVLMGVSILAYVILDGYDLGVGILIATATDDEKDIMISSIGPFWDANETWLVMGVGLLLVAFPHAHGAIMQALYMPVTVMLIALILRGVAFDFRVKARADHKGLWNTAFLVGSAGAALAQGYMLGMLVVGFERNAGTVLFALGISVCMAFSYVLLGAGWLLMKTSGELQRKAIGWAKRSLVFFAAGLLAVSVVTPLMNPRVFERWFTLQSVLGSWPLPLMATILIGVTYRALGRLPLRLDNDNEYGVWVPFGCAVGLFMLAFHGLAYSLFPWLILDQMTIWQAAAAPESLRVILVGVVMVLPIIILYTIFAYRVFHGKTTPLEYY
ncbi:MAG: cytochrome d ubiquinol oxidase subunit II [Gammaproteobacteria bacterium]